MLRRRFPFAWEIPDFAPAGRNRVLIRMGRLFGSAAIEKALPHRIVCICEQASKRRNSRVVLDRLFLDFEGSGKRLERLFETSLSCEIESQGVQTLGIMAPKPRIAIFERGLFPQGQSPAVELLACRSVVAEVGLVKGQVVERGRKPESVFVGVVPHRSSLIASASRKSASVASFRTSSL